MLYTVLYRHAVLLLSLPVVGLIAAAATGTIPAAALPAYFLGSALTTPSILLFNVWYTSFFSTEEAALGMLILPSLLVTIVPSTVAPFVTSAVARFVIQVAFMVVPLNQFTNVLSGIMSIYIASSYKPTPASATEYFWLTFDPYASISDATRAQMGVDDFTTAIGQYKCRRHVGKV